MYVRSKLYACNMLIITTRMPQAFGSNAVWNKQRQTGQTSLRKPQAPKTGSRHSRQDPNARQY